MDASDRARFVSASDQLHDVARPMRVLSHLAWPAEVRRRFLDGGATALPEVTYPSFDPAPTVEAVTRARRLLHPGDGVVDRWLDGTAETIATTAQMLAAAGTARFHDYSRDLYGAPDRVLPNTSVTSHELSLWIHEVLHELVDLEIGLTSAPTRTAPEVHDDIVAGLARVFGADAPPVQIVADLSANAAASAKGIRLRRDALFTDRDAAQLLQHEAYIHVATAFNGRRQPLRILGIGHPRTTRTQEGLAVFAELASSTAELDRMRRLADRTLAIQMVIDGADFIELYRWFLDRTPTPEQAFESARRCFRGGPLTGGAPFTKDVVYLEGLLEVASAVRTAFAAQRVDVLELLFVGKLSLQAIPALAECAAAGLVVQPAFLPPWVSDPRGILALLTLTTFLARIDLPPMVAAVRDLLDACPVVELAREPAAPAAS